MTVSAGTRLGPYEIEDLLGAGGMGEVYRAADPRLGREVAVKVLPSEVASDSARLSLFEREARAVAALNHPNILTVHDVGTHEGTPYVVTELLEGKTLRELATRRAPTAQQILAYMLQAARGLEAAHAKDIVHRDLKPENLFLTTDGRVKVLDFGLAKLVRSQEEIHSDISTAAHSTPPGQVAGTILYMSPEQARAQAIDVRSDVFSFGVVLYELLAGRHPFRKDTVAGTLTAIVEETPPDLETLKRGIPPSIGGIVRRCLEKAREDRYASGHDVVVALEAVLAAPSGAAALREVEERSPYPGLSSFTEKDAAVFFGREREVEELWARIRSRKLLAVIGPSGAGKTSFVRAGVLPARPQGWAALVSKPGAAPFRGLGQELIRGLAGDVEALQQILSIDDVDTAVDLVRRWRRDHGEALLVVDQFEELFTLNPPEVQRRFVTLLARLAEEADVHVLLALRDDFLIRCCEQVVMTPVLRELTALVALRPEDLRRAIEEPAKKRGYRFEDEALVAEMVESVEGARAALPLLAFAVSRLWEKRDREGKTLTRAAYEDIGGVAGALAQHAEATMDRIGAEHQGVVREIFRNLFTAQGTRAVIDREELLTAFPHREVAETVLGQLIDARLLTSYEVDDPGRHSERAVVEDRAKNLSVRATPSHRIEIVHESLLKAWPRLVRWQMQDEEGAQLRDQLKQAAHLWEERGRSPDVLWSGMALQEYELWRQRYAGKLTALEESFAGAMVERDRRRKRVRRGAVAAAFVALAVVAAAFAVSRQQVAASRDEARAEALRAEASKLLALAQTRLDEDPTEALAYTTSSLELADTAEARLMALRALAEAPPSFDLPFGEIGARNPAFSPDGRWLAAGGHGEVVRVWEDRGGEPLVLAGHRANPQGGVRTAWVSDRLLLTGMNSNVGGEVYVWSLPEGKRVRTIDIGAPAWWQATPNRLLVETMEGERGDMKWETFRLRSWRLPDGGAEELGRVDVAEMNPYSSGFDPSAKGWLHTKKNTVFVRPLPTSPGARSLVLNRHEGRAGLGWFPSRPERFWAFDEAGLVQVFSVSGDGRELAHEIRRPNTTRGVVAPESSGRWLTTDPRAEARADLWRAGELADAQPLSLRRSGSWYLAGFDFHPAGEWFAVATTSRGAATFWPLRKRYPLVVDGYGGTRRPVAFSPDSRWVATTWPDLGLRLWPLPGSGSSEARILDLPRRAIWSQLVFEPKSRFLFAVGIRGMACLVPLDGSPVRRLTGYSEDVMLEAAAVSASGRWVASAYSYGGGEKSLRVWDSQTGEARLFPLPETRVNAALGKAGYAVSVLNLFFADDETLYSAGNGGLRRWNLTDGSQEVVLPSEDAVMVAELSDDKRWGLSRPMGLGRRTDCTGVEHFDLGESTSRLLPEFGDCVVNKGFDSAGRLVVTGDRSGVVRVGDVLAGTPHILAGHEGPVDSVAISPDQRWVASTGEDNTLRIWPVPDLAKTPLHALPRDELLTKLRALTNVRAVRDPESSTGWSMDLDPFPGWKEVPEW